jgi:hypothetical protein
MGKLLVLLAMIYAYFPSTNILFQLTNEGKSIILMSCSPGIMLQCSGQFNFSE